MSSNSIVAIIFSIIIGFILLGSSNASSSPANVTTGLVQLENVRIDRFEDKLGDISVICYVTQRLGAHPSISFVKR